MDGAYETTNLIAAASLSDTLSLTIFTNIRIFKLFHIRIIRIKYPHKNGRFRICNTPMFRIIRRICERYVETLILVIFAGLLMMLKQGKGNSLKLCIKGIAHTTGCPKNLSRPLFIIEINGLEYIIHQLYTWTKAPVPDIRFSGYPTDGVLLFFPMTILKFTQFSECNCLLYNILLYQKPQRNDCIRITEKTIKPRAHKRDRAIFSKHPVLTLIVKGEFALLRGARSWPGVRLPHCELGAPLLYPSPRGLGTGCNKTIARGTASVPLRMR